MMLREGPVIVQYLSDQVPEAELAPPHGTFERYQLQEMLNFLSTEFTKALFRSSTRPWQAVTSIPRARYYRSAMPG